MNNDFFKRAKQTAIEIALFISLLAFLAKYVWAQLAWFFT